MADKFENCSVLVSSCNSVANGNSSDVKFFGAGTRYSHFLVDLGNPEYPVKALRQSATKGQREYQQAQKRQWSEIRFNLLEMLNMLNEELISLSFCLTAL